MKLRDAIEKARQWGEQTVTVRRDVVVSMAAVVLVLGLML